MIEAHRRIGPLLLAAVLALAACGGGSGGGVLIVETSGGPVQIQVEVADTSAERQRGLMGRTELAPDAGMVFLHSEPTTSGFFMKNTLIPLSVAFWDEEGRIIGSVDMEPCRQDPCPTYPPPGPWIGAVEVNQGFFEEHGIEAGDTVDLRLS